MNDTKKQVQLLVSFDIPEGGNAQECVEYAKKAIQGFCGSQDPNEPIYMLNAESVNVFEFPLNIEIRLDGRKLRDCLYTDFMEAMKQA